MYAQQLETHSCNFCNFSSSIISSFVTHMISKHSNQIKEDNSTKVGCGEKILVEILQEKLPECVIYTQVHLNYLVPKEETLQFSERQVKETIDVLLLHKNRFIIFRVQHGSNCKYRSKGHLWDKLSQSDSIQKRLVQRYHGKYSVIDLRESECKVLFSNINNWYSQSEVGIQCELEGLRL